MIVQLYPQRLWTGARLQYLLKMFVILDNTFCLLSQLYIISSDDYECTEYSGVNVLTKNSPVQCFLWIGLGYCHTVEIIFRNLQIMYFPQKPNDASSH